MTYWSPSRYVLSFDDLNESGSAAARSRPTDGFSAMMSVFPMKLSRVRAPAAARLLPRVGILAAAGRSADRASRRQLHDREALVVGLVRLPDAVGRVGDVLERERPLEARHVDPLLVVGRRVDVRPAHRR